MGNEEQGMRNGEQKKGIGGMRNREQGIENWEWGVGNRKRKMGSGNEE